MANEADSGVKRTHFYPAVALAAAVALWVTITVPPVWTMLIPVFLTALPLIVSDRSVQVSASLALLGMCVFIVLGLLSVGMFFVPSALALTFGLFWHWRVTRP